MINYLPIRLLLVLPFLIPCFAFAQLHDGIWLTGVKSSTWPGDWDNTSIDFGISSAAVYQDSQHLFTVRMGGTSISDEIGNLQFYTNGFTVANKQHQLLENGDSLNLPEDYYNNYVGGSIVPQATISLPDPANTQQYYLLHINSDNVLTPQEYTLYGSHLFYSKIDMAQNNGLGKMVEKNQLALADSITAGALTAVKHANGRDWWVLVFKFWSKKYYRILVSENGVEVLGQQQIDVRIQKGQFGQFVFSPDGSKFASTSTAWGQQQRHWIDIFDFDRCSGLLSNRKRVYCSKRYENNGVPTSDHAQGLAFSPNSRFLYLYLFNKAYQVDTWPTNAQQTLSLLGNYDGFSIIPTPNSYPFLTVFGLSQLAPDGRIYVNTAHPTPYFHITERPNNQGITAKFTQHSLELPGYNNGHIPNHPNYRLGPLEGSGCDTLGIEKTISILAHPYPSEACIGGEAHFEVTAFGTGRSYQRQSSSDGGSTWQNLSDGGHFTQTTTEYLLLHDVPAAFDGKQFRCVVTGNISTETSRPATLTLIGQLPVAAYSFVQDKDSLHFQNLSTGYEYFEWKFSDGDSTLLENPSRLYTHVGTYPALLIATNACGQDTFAQDIVIPELLAEFHADRTHGCAPFTVKYTSDVPYRVSNQKYLTPGSSIPVAWANNGKHTVTYNTPGTFDATLMAFTPQAVEKDTLKKTGYITVLTGINPTADISAQYDSAGVYTLSLTIGGQCGGVATATATVTVSGTSATGSAVRPAGPFTVFPNPASGQVFFCFANADAGRLRHQAVHGHRRGRCGAKKGTMGRLGGHEPGAGSGWPLLLFH
jgi:PKD repeat protein